MSYDYKVASADVLNAAEEIVYSGASFTAALKWAVAHASTTTYIPAGTYTLAADVPIGEGSTFYGDGDDTVLTSVSYVYILISDVSSVTVQRLTLNGDVGIMILESAGNTDGSHTIEDISVIGLSPSAATAFVIYANDNSTVDGVAFTRCSVADSASFGFMIDGGGCAGGSLVKNVTFTDCSAINCGRYSRINDWVTGFDICEKTNIENIIVTGCEASGSWESGFHLEYAPSETGVQFTDCIANDNGQKPSSTYGMGFLFLSSKVGLTGINFTDCVGSGNSRGLSPLLQGVLA